MALSLRRRLKQEASDKAGNSNKDIYIEAVFAGKDPFLLAALNLVDIGKGVVDTFKPYKSKSYIHSDAAIPLRGIGNLFLAGWYAFTAVFFFAFNIVKCFTYDLFKEGPKACIINFAKAIYGLVGGLLQAAATALRGAIELATAPLTWAIRMPIRGLIYAKNKGYQPFEENAGVQRLVKLGNDVTSSNIHGSREKTKEIIEQLKRKCAKSIDPNGGRGQQSIALTKRFTEFTGAATHVETLFFPTDPKKPKPAANALLTPEEQQAAQAFFHCFRKN